MSPSILLDANKQALSLWRYQQFNIYTEEEAQEFAGLHLAKSRAWVINSDKVSNVALKDSLADFNNASIGRNLITVGSWWIAYLSGNDEFEKNSLSVDLLAEQTINLTATLIINRSGWDWKDRAFGTCYLIGLRESVAPPAS